MSSTALPPPAALASRRIERLEAISSTSSSVSGASSPNLSPIDSPRTSPSSTSLSSLASESQDEKPAARLVDTYGNRFEIPDFTIKDIRDAIPARCFERSALTGLSYIARDMACLAITFYIFHNYVTPETIRWTPLRVALWAGYTFIQGLFATGLWVIAHECGHQSFSTSKTINDSVGWILHSALLVPYFSWKISHGKHHKATGHLERDMVFVPATREVYASNFGKLAHQIEELTEDTPIATLLQLVKQQLGGWPAYLITNMTGHNFHHRQSEGKGKGKRNGLGSGVNHFDPASPLYEKKDEHLILLSDLGLALAIGALAYLGMTFGWSNLFVWYLLPYLWVNHWLVAITFLQHTDPSLPHYMPESWTFARGAAATIDRNFWPIGPYLFHGIIETHVLHHYVSTIPFYHADDATEAIKPVMGKHYRSDTRGGMWGFVRSLWQSARMCQWIEQVPGTEGDERGVLFFRNKNGLGLSPAPLKAA